MTTNIFFKEHIIVLGNNSVETGSFFLDPTFIVSAITLFLTLATFIFSMIIFRPKVHVEIKNILYKDLLKSYELVITNNGNVMAEDIKIEFQEDLNEALNYNCPRKDGDGFCSFHFIKHNLSKEIKYLPSDKDVRGLFITTEKGDDNTSPILFNKKFTVSLTYRNSITRWKYKKQKVTLELKKSDWFTEYNMSDNLGYDLKILLDELKKISGLSENISYNLYEVALDVECKKNEKVKKIFNSLNIKERQVILNILGIKSKENRFFISHLKKYIKNKNNALTKKIRKLQTDEFSYFLTVVRNFRDNI